MAKVDNYTKDAALRARKAKVLIAAVLNRSTLEPEAVRFLEHAMRYMGDVTDTLLRNDDTTRQEILDTNSLAHVLPSRGADTTSEITSWRNNPINV